VIKARGITDLPEYLGLERRGRRFPLRETQREAIWTVYEKYEELLSASGKIDWHDVIALTLRQIEMDEKLDRHEAPFSSVIVDEAQDFSLNGMRLIRKLAAESDDGLLLLGDSGQQILPGGYRLIEAGVTIAGSRSLTLSLNYRNGSNIKKRADEVLANTFDESSLYEGSFGHEPGASVCAPGSVAEGSFRSTTDQADALVRFLRSQRPAGWGTMAVLTESWKDLSRWKGVLKRASIPCALLSDTDPRLTSDQVVVGTFTKAKGLEFASVAIPMPFPRSASGPEEAERLLLESQRLYVGISRAVSSLWIGKLSRPATFEMRSA
jgi:superfamily I DNA/RNA helicase